MFGEPPAFLRQKLTKGGNGSKNGHGITLGGPFVATFPPHIPHSTPHTPKPHTITPNIGCCRRPSALAGRHEAVDPPAVQASDGILPLPHQPPRYPSTLNPQPSTLNPQLSTLNPQPSTLNPQPHTQTDEAAQLRAEAAESAAACSLLEGALRDLEGGCGRLHAESADAASHLAHQVFPNPAYAALERHLAQQVSHELLTRTPKVRTPNPTP
jgi:hypothetical protein